MKKKRFLAMLLAVAMVLSLVPAPARAAEVGVIGSNDPSDGVVLNKTLTPDEQGTYTLNLEAYVTGESETVVERAPTDITIIMDVSGSMEESDMGTKDSKDYAFYPYTLAECYAYYQSGHKFYHKYNNTYHDVEIIYIPNFSGDLYEGSSSGYSSSDNLDKRDIYAYKCTKASCNYSSSYYNYCITYNNSNVYFTDYVTRDPGAGSTTYFPDSYEIYWYTNELSRMESMKNAINDFITRIDSANKKDGVYYSEELQHRIGLVKFAGHIFKGRFVGNTFYCTLKNSYTGKETYYSSPQYGYYTSNGTTRFYDKNCTQILLGTADSLDNVSGSSLYVNSGTLSTLQSAITNLHSGGATRADNGLSMASLVLGYNKESAPNRKQVVLFFTDGEPTEITGFNTTVANDAIANAEALKTAGATVYAINISPSGNVGEQMETYMNRVSSNYEGATSMTSTGTQVSTEYYKAVANAEELANLFKDFESTVNPADLTDKADLRDYMAEGIELTDGTTVTASIVPYAGNENWEDGNVVQVWRNGVNIENHEVQISVNKETGLVSVTGFNYKENFVEDRNGTPQGAKLMISITGVKVTEAAAVSPEGYIYTNKPESGVYPSTTSTKPKDTFPRPYVLAEDDHVVLDKTAKLEDNGTYTINLEAFATGRPYSYQERKPADITIVLDVSGSMKEQDFATENEKEWRSYTGYLAAAISQQASGIQFAHTATSGIRHKITLYYIPNCNGTYNCYYADGVWADTIEIKNQDVFAYYCESCSSSSPYATIKGYDIHSYASVTPGSDPSSPSNWKLQQYSNYVPRMEAMKEAVNKFIDQTVADCADFATSKQHRISLVKFAGEYFTQFKTGNHFHSAKDTENTGANIYTAKNGSKYYVTATYDGITDTSCTSNCTQILTYSQYAKSSNAETLKATVDSMIAGGATQANYGFQLADEVLTRNTTGTSGREQIVLFFTDGSPTSKSDFDPDVANAAIAAAKELKAKGAKVYSVSLSPEGHTDAEDMHTYMELVSSNYSTATKMGDIDKMEAEHSKYHLTVHNSEELKNIFDTITQTISAPPGDLDAEAQLRDYLAQGFNLTKNSVITVKTVPYAGKVDGERTWGTPTEVQVWKNGDNTKTHAVKVHVDTETNAISVDGFDYKTCYVNDTNENACKLVVTITGIEATDEAITNGMVPTNKDTSGIYPGGNGSSKPTARFPVPEVMLTSKIYVLDYAKPATLEAEDWNASQANHLDADGMNYFVPPVVNSITDTYGFVHRDPLTGNTYDNTYLVYTPRTTLWNGYDNFYSFGKQEDGLTNLWSRISVLPANSVYYEDTFITTNDSSTVGITYTGSWDAYTAPTTEPAEPETIEQWVKVDFADITDKDTIAITMTKGDTTWVLPNVGEGGNKQPLANISGTISGTTLTVAGGNSAVSWNIAPAADGYHITAGGNYLYVTNDNNGVRIGTPQGGKESTAIWTVANNYLSANDGTNTRYLGVYAGAPDWRCYKTYGGTSNIAGQTLEFWKLTEVESADLEGTGTNTEVENGPVHGWVEDLSDDTGFTDGSAYGISLENPNDIATATFRFTGTGVDIYTYTDIQSGVVNAMLMRMDTADGEPELVKFHIIDNLAVSGQYYQIPTLSFMGLDYGTYQVTLSVRRAPAVDENNTITEGYRSTYYLDGIRVYNPIQDLENDAIVQEAYENELSAIFQEVRQSLIDTNSFDASSTDVSGSVFIDLNGKLDGNGDESDTTDDMTLEEAMGVYVDYGPKHEVYLAPGQGIAFKVDVKVDVKDDANFYLGIKSPAPGVNIKNAGAEVTASQVTLTNAANASPVEIKHTSDLYYEVTPNGDGLIFVINSGDTLISITKLRSTGSSQGIISAKTEEIASYVNSFRSLPMVDYVEQPEPPAEPTPEPSLWDVLEQIRKLLENLFGSLDSWFNP